MGLWWIYFSESPRIFFEVSVENWKPLISFYGKETEGEKKKGRKGRDQKLKAFDDGFLEILGARKGISLLEDLEKARKGSFQRLSGTFSAVVSVDEHDLKESGSPLFFSILYQTRFLDRGRRVQQQSLQSLPSTQKHRPPKARFSPFVNPIPSD